MAKRTPTAKGETPMERLERLTKKILQVPKEAIREPKDDKSQRASLLR